MKYTIDFLSLNQLGENSFLFISFHSKKFNQSKHLFSEIINTEVYLFLEKL